MTFILTVGVLGILATFLALRVIFAKDEEVRKPGCANVALFMAGQGACPVCGVGNADQCAVPVAEEKAAAGRRA